MTKGDVVEVAWHDGKEYKAKIIDVVSTHIKVRYHRFTAKHDEWIDLSVDGKKVKRPCGSSAVSSTSPNRYAPLEDECVDPDQQQETINDSDCSGASKFNGADKQSYKLPSGPGAVPGGVEQKMLVRGCESVEPSGPDQFDAGGVVPLEVDAGDGRKRRIDSDSDDGRPINARRNSKKQRNSSPLLSPTAVERAQTVSSNTSEVTSRRAQQEAGPCQCKFCGVVVVGVKILCQGCSGSFHPDVLCLGVRSEVVQGLIADDEGALSYNCNECRLRVQAIDSGEGTNVVLRQLMCSVGELAKIVRGLKVDRNFSRDVIREPMQQAVSEACSEHIPQRAIFDQVREVREREKRADSVVFRGLGDVPLQEVSSKFLAICRELRLPSITLVGLTKIGTTNLYRARIADKTFVGAY